MLDNKILAMWSLFCAVRNSNLTGWSSWKIKRLVTDFHYWHPVVLCNHKNRTHQENNMKETSSQVQELNALKENKHKTQQSALTTNTFKHFWNKCYAWRWPMQV